MHSFIHEEFYLHDRITTTINHNGDYSGDVQISVRTTPITLNVTDYEKIDTFPVHEVEVPMRALKEFIGDYIRSKRIAELEEATTEDILS